MSERFVSKLEDPLPVHGDHAHLYTKEPHGSLGEVVVTDPRDPFVWLATDVSKVHEAPSSNGKQLLWLIYRMNGNLPQIDQDIKWRDERVDTDSILHHLSLTDIGSAYRYQQHLAHIAADEALKQSETSKTAVDLQQPEMVSEPMRLHGPNAAHIFAAIMHHLELIGDGSQNAIIDTSPDDRLHNIHKEA